MAITYRTTTYGGADAPLTNLQIDENFSWLNTNKAAATHVHSAADITSGVLSTARLGTGTPSSSNYLRGDGSWATILSGATLSNDTTSTATHYLGMSTSSTGAWTSAIVTTTKLSFVPSTGTLSATNFNTLSDASEKTDLEKITNALDKVKQLTGYTYTLIASGQRSSGLLAQNVLEVQPELVGQTEDGKLNLAYGNMLGLIVESIKELSAQVEELQKRIEK